MLRRPATIRRRSFSIAEAHGERATVWSPGEAVRRWLRLSTSREFESIPKAARLQAWLAQKLYFHQEALPLALRDAQDTLHGGTVFHFGMAGGLFADLVLAKRIGVVEERAGKPLDAALEKIAGAKRHALPHGWIYRLSGLKRLLDATAGTELKSSFESPLAFAAWPWRVRQRRASRARPLASPRLRPRPSLRHRRPKGDPRRR